MLLKDTPHPERIFSATVEYIIQSPPPVGKYIIKTRRVIRVNNKTNK
jgi:hypothetical protein